MRRKNKSFIEICGDLSIEPLIKYAPIWLFAIASLIIGFAFMQTYSTFTGPDMPTHYKSALALATGQSFTEPIKEGYVKQSYINGDSDYFMSGDKCTHNLTISDALKIWPQSDGMEQCIINHDNYVEASDTSTVPVVLQYPPINYLPQTAGISLGMTFDAEPINAQKYARWMNLLTYITIIVLAIAVIPRAKWLLAILGALPPALFLASSLSADAIMIAWSFLFIAIVMRMYMQQKTVTWGQLTLLGILGVALFVLKIAYAPLLLLILIIPRSVMNTKVKSLLIITTVISGGLLYLFWSSNWGSMNAIIDTAQNAGIIKDNFIKTMVAIAINILLVPLHIFRPETALYLASTILIAAIIIMNFIKHPVQKVKTVKEVLTVYQLPIVGLVLFSLCLGMTFGALLLTWNDIASTGFVNIVGFQGRYVLPLLPLLALLFFMPRGTNRQSGVHDS